MWRIWAPIPGLFDANGRASYRLPMSIGFRASIKFVRQEYDSHCISY